MLKRVYNLNDGNAKLALKQRASAITDDGTKEGHLPDVQRELNLQRNRLERENVKNRFS